MVLNFYLLIFAFLAVVSLRYLMYRLAFCFRIMYEKNTICHKQSLYITILDNYQCFFKRSAQMFILDSFFSEKVFAPFFRILCACWIIHTKSDKHFFFNSWDFSKRLDTEMTIFTNQCTNFLDVAVHFWCWGSSRTWIVFGRFTSLPKLLNHSITYVR